MLRHAREQRCDDPAAFRRGMRNLVESARAGERGAFNLRHLKVGEVLLEVTSLVRTHHVQPDPVFTTLVCAIVVLEGLGRQLDPTLDLFAVNPKKTEEPRKKLIDLSKSSQASKITNWRHRKGRATRAPLRGMCCYAALVPRLV